MAGLLRDTRFAVRQLRRNLGFTITATVMLAVAICANSTVFSWIGTMLHPIPGARHTDELVSVMRGELSASPRMLMTALEAQFQSELQRARRADLIEAAEASIGASTSQTVSQCMGRDAEIRTGE